MLNESLEACLIMLTKKSRELLKAIAEAVVTALLGIFVIILLGLLVTLGLTSHNIEKMLEKK